MTERMTRQSIAAALTLLAAVATGAAAQTAAVTGMPVSSTDQRYRLVEVAGSALPVEVEKEWTCRESVTRAALTLGADSTWTLRSTIREVCGDRAEVETDVEHGRYIKEGGSLRFYDEGEDDGDWELERDLDLEDFESGSLAPDASLAVRLDDGKTILLFKP